MKIISWNIAHRKEPWFYLHESDADVALLQEASQPPIEVQQEISVDEESWETVSPGNNSLWRTAVVKLSDKVDVKWIKPIPIGQAGWGQFAVSRPGTLAAAQVRYKDELPVILISMYGFWEIPHELTGSNWLYADASVHRLISDLSKFIGTQHNHRIIASGDLNILHGYGENGSKYWGSRYATIFSRMESLGLKFVGPQAPNGRQADPWPSELPLENKNVPTFYSSRQTPETATRQLDFVFASENLVDKIEINAINQPDQWGSSDHCMVKIDVIF